MTKCRDHMDPDRSRQGKKDEFMKNVTFEIASKCGMAEDELVFLDALIGAFTQGILEYEIDCTVETETELLDLFKSLSTKQVSYVDDGTTVIFSIITSFEYCIDQEIIKYIFSPYFERFIAKTLISKSSN